jgi:hypothetical protein
LTAPARQADANGSSAEAVQIAVLQKALEMERSTVNIFA